MQPSLKRNPCEQLFARVLALLDVACKTPEIEFDLKPLEPLLSPLSEHTRARIKSQYTAFGRALRNQHLYGSKKTISTLNRRFTRLRFTIDYAEVEAFERYS